MVRFGGSCKEQHWRIVRGQGVVVVVWWSTFGSYTVPLSLLTPCYCITATAQLESTLLAHFAALLFAGIRVDIATRISRKACHLPYNVAMLRIE